MASDATLSSFAVAVETNSFGELDSNSIPNASGITFGALQVERAAFFESPEERVNEMDLTRSDYAETRLEPIVVMNNTGGALYGAADGTPFRAFKGADISVTFRCQNIGSANNFATHDDMPWLRLLKSSMGILSPGAATDLIAAAADASTTTATTIGNFAIGMGARLIRDNVAVDNFVADISGNDITWAFEWPGGAPSGTLRLCSTLYPINGTTPDTVAIRFDMDERRMYGFGCRVANPSFNMDEDGVLTCTCVIRPAVILRDDSNAAVATATIPEGHVIHKRGATQYYSADQTTASAAGLAVTELGLRSWDFELELEISPEEGAGALKGMLGMTEQLIQGSRPRLTITGQPDSTLENMLRLRESRGFVMGYGPASDDKAEGMAIAMMSATRNNANMGIGENNGQQMLTTVLRGNSWTLDGSSANAGNTEWRIALPN